MDRRGGRKKRQVVKTPEVMSWFKSKVSTDSHATLSTPDSSMKIHSVARLWYLTELRPPLTPVSCTRWHWGPYRKCWVSPLFPYQSHGVVARPDGPATAMGYDVWFKLSISKRNCVSFRWSVSLRCYWKKSASAPIGSEWLVLIGVRCWWARWF